MEVNGAHQLFDYQHSSKYLLFLLLFSRTKKFIKVSNIWRVSQFSFLGEKRSHKNFFFFKYSQVDFYFIDIILSESLVFFLSELCFHKRYQGRF